MDNICKYKMKIKITVLYCFTTGFDFAASANIKTKGAKNLKHVRELFYIGTELLDTATARFNETGFDVISLCIEIDV